MSFFFQTLSAYSKQIDQQAKALRDADHQRFNLSKLSTLGEVAAGIAHEFNNPLAIAVGNLSLCSETLNRGGQRERLMRMEKALARISRVVHCMQSFERRSSSRIEAIDVATEVSNSCTIIQQMTLDLKVRLLVKGPDEFWIDSKRQELNLPLLNIIKNAVEAASGTPESLVVIDWYGRDQELVIEVRDSGPGVSPEKVARLFEPFFTTRSDPNHQGMGLSVSKNLISSLGGSIEYEGREGMTVFSIVIAKNLLQIKRAS